jgi:hypothetical protein
LNDIPPMGSGCLQRSGLPEAAIGKDSKGSNPLIHLATATASAAARHKLVAFSQSPLQNGVRSHNSHANSGESLGAS